MIFKETKLKGAFIIKPELKKDRRGFFARSFCQKELKKIKLNYHIAQANISFNKKKGTIRGMHYQAAPHKEAKLVYCPKGAIFDVIIDLRKNSSTYCQWLSVELNSDNNKMIYIPKGFAHGFQTLKDETLVFYQMFEFYHPRSARGIRWDDPLFEIKWPLRKKTISKKDKSYKSFQYKNFK